MRPKEAQEAVWQGRRGAARENSIAMAMNLPIAPVRFGRLELFQSPIVDNPLDSVAVAGASHRFPGDREPWQGHFRAVFFSSILLSSAGTKIPAGPIEDATAALERRDFATALQLLRPLAERGNADAQMKLGFLYVAGGGIPQDYAAAVKWFHLAADQGQANAQCFLGLMYFEGRGVPRDYVSAHVA